MPAPGRTLLVAVVLAAVLGFAAGWLAHATVRPGARERFDRAGDELRKGFRELGR